jgi:hypothetical protein
LHWSGCQPEIPDKETAFVPQTSGM